MKIRKRARRAALCAAAILAFACRVDASTVQIGQIFVSNDPFAGLGPVFTVENDSQLACDPSDATACYAGDFAHAVMSLTGTSDSGAFDSSFAFVDVFSGSDAIGAGGVLDSSTLDLSDPSLVFSQALFTLRFSVQGSLSIAPLTDFTDGSTTAILFTPAAPSAVPEPATWVLLGVGLIGSAAGRARADARRRRQATAQ